MQRPRKAAFETEKHCKDGLSLEPTQWPSGFEPHTESPISLFRDLWPVSAQFRYVHR